MTCRICQSYTSEVVNATYGRPEGLCLACGAGYLDGFAAGYEAAVRDFWRSVCLEIADRLERNRWQLNEMKLSFEKYLAADEMLTARAAQLRAWAGET